MSMRIPAAAARLSITQKTLRGMCARGEIPATKLGKVWVFEEALLNAWLRDRCQQNVRALPDSQPHRLRAIRGQRNSLAERLDQALVESPQARPSVTGARAARGSKEITMLPPIGQPSAEIELDLLRDAIRARQAREANTAHSADDLVEPHSSQLSDPHLSLIRLIARAAMRPGNSEKLAKDLKTPQGRKKR